LRQQLHYLHEATDSSNQPRFVYFCTECFCILKVRRGLEPLDSIVEILENRCPGCGATLEGSLSCKLTPVADAWSEITPSSYAARRVRPERVQLFREASFARGSSLDLPVERLLGGFAPGRVAVLTGRCAGGVAEFLCFRAQLPRRHGGLDTDVVFIDGGNCSDPYLFASYARQYMVRPLGALKRVVTSRAFTIYQLANLVRRELPDVLDEYASRFVIISDILNMFNDPSIEAREARRVLEGIRDGLRKVRRRGDVFVLATLVTRTPYDDLITGAADLLLNLESPSSRIVETLLGHPPKQRSLQRGEEGLRPLLRERGHTRYG